MTDRTPAHILDSYLLKHKQRNKVSDKQGVELFEGISLPLAHCKAVPLGHLGKEQNSQAIWVPL